MSKKWFGWLAFVALLVAFPSPGLAQESAGRSFVASVLALFVLENHYGDPGAGRPLPSAAHRLTSRILEPRPGSTTLYSNNSPICF